MVPINWEIRKFYHPLQPTVKRIGGKVTYREIKPLVPLQVFIYCYWQLKTSYPLSDSYIYRVIADGCIDIFFELNTSNESFVMGFSRNFTEFSLGNTFDYIGIRFLPTVFPQLYETDASKLSNHFESMTLISPETSGFIATEFKPTYDLEKAKVLLDTYFIKKFSEAKFKIEPRFYGAIGKILENRGNLNIKRDLDTGICQRHLQ